MWTIYKITNKINGKIYVGQTSRPVEQRWQEHKNGKTNKAHTSPLTRAINKYGWENFKTEVIETVNSAEEANIQEQYWIEYYHCAIPKYGKNCGYNLTLGGEGTKTITDIQKQAILQLWEQQNNITQISNKTHIDRHVISEVLTQFGVNCQDKNKHRFYHFHPVYVYNLTGSLIDVFDSLSETLKEYIDIPSNSIEEVLNHRHASTHNLIFLYEEDLEQLSKHLQRANSCHLGNVKSTNLKTGETIIYSTITEAERKTGIPRQTIRNRIRKTIIRDDIKWEDIN